MHGLVEALVVALVVVGALVVVLGVHVLLLRDLAVGVELARWHAVQRACLGLGSLGNGRPRRVVVVARRVHYMR